MILMLLKLIGSHLSWFVERVGKGTHSSVVNTAQHLQCWGQSSWIISHSPGESLTLIKVSLQAETCQLCHKQNKSTKKGKSLDLQLLCIKKYRYHCCFSERKTMHIKYC